MDNNPVTLKSTTYFPIYLSKAKNVAWGGGVLFVGFLLFGSCSIHSLNTLLLAFLLFRVYEE